MKLLSCFLPCFLPCFLILCQRLVVGLYTYREERMSCLEGRMRCHGDQGCRTLLDAIPELCDKEVSMCMSSKRDQCASTLTSLQMNPYFYSCQCEPIDMDATQCIEFQWLIFHHACLRKGVYNRTVPGLYRPPLELTRLPSQEYAYYEDGDDGGDNEVLDHRYDISCTGVRKNCLLNSKCNRELADFREKCRENKKTGRCVTDDRDGCFRTISELLGTGIFSCMCHMQRQKQSRQRCDRIQWRLANNTCLVEVPYFIHSRQAHEQTYQGLLSFVDSAQRDQHGPLVIQETAFEGNCVQAFAACNADQACQMRMSGFMDACAWGASNGNTCNRHECLSAIHQFYLYVRPEHSHALLFCSCVSEEDEKCVAIRAGMYPTCSVVELPPPSCLDIVNRCTQDPDCRVRLNAYQVHCGYDRRAGGCPSTPDMCRSAMVGMMGTILTTNCTCQLENHYDNTKCIEARQRLQNDNICKEMAIKDFQAQYTTPAKAEIWGGPASTDKAECRRHLGYTIPKYMEVPSVIRKYDNESDCSFLCECMRNESLRCEKLPCTLDLSCRVKNSVYIHGASFTQEENRQCRCIKGEVVCAKIMSVRKKAGLFMHIGYSVGDLYLIEGHSNIKFDGNNVAAKLGALVNGESEKQFCKVTMYTKEEGNIVFEISVSSDTSNERALEVCIRSSQRLSYMINSRDLTILTDAELSVLKVSQLEQVHFHNAARNKKLPEIHTSPHSSAPPSALFLTTRGILGTTWLCVLLVRTCL